MRTVLMIILFALSAQTAQGQTWNEWFKQKKTQRKYLLQQIAALKVYAEFAKKGYKIARQGLNLIGSFKNGEFNLHADYFNSLKNINPEIRRYAKIAQIADLQVRIVQDYNRTFRQVRRENQLNESELDYLVRVFGRLMDDCQTTLDQLIAVTTAGKLELTDDQRVAEIDRLFTQMQENYVFAKDFNRQSLQLSITRKKEQNDVKTSGAMHGINEGQ